MSNIETMKLALEALERNDYLGWQVNKPVIKALRQALEQAEPDYKALWQQMCERCDELDKQLAQQTEPVAWLQIGLAPFHDGDVIARTVKPKNWNPEWWKFQPLYTSPPPRQPLTDEEIEDLYFDKFSMGELKAFARAIEAAHGIKEKNT